MRKLRFILLPAMVMLSHGAVAEDNPADICKNAAQLFNDGDTEGALEEARWCVSLLEQAQQKAISKHFPDELQGFSGDQVQQQNAMGFMTVERFYYKGDSEITVSLNAGSSGGAMQALSALTQFGLQSGMGKKMRIQKRNAVVSSEDGFSSVHVSMKSGGVLMFESSTVPVEKLTAFAKAFPVADLDSSMN